jgi:ATP-dependent DNA helicase RecG
MGLRLDTLVQYLKGVGPRRAEAFARVGVATVEDLLYHLPHRYLDATLVTPVARADVGTEVTLVGRVVSKGVLPTRRRLRIFRAVIKDASGLIECAWPGQAFLDRTVREGQLLLVSGPVKYYHGRQIVPREHIVLSEPDDDGEEEDGGQGLVVPIYPATEGLTHRQIRRVIGLHLDDMLACVEESTPRVFLQGMELPPLKEALLAVHRPASVDQAERGRRRFAFDELLDLQFVLARARYLAKHTKEGVQHVVKKDLTTALKHALPFDLTAGQRRAVREITADMAAPERMHRLLMGDVGSGKTVVALFAILLALENDRQAVFMAPTELLTEQHARTISALLAPLGLVPEVLLGRLQPSEKAAIRGRIADGSGRVVIGTHALFQEKTEFRSLGLVVIDEQHRFGVEQRAALIAKGEAPDVLLLSATPIPRTLAFTLYGDLDISMLREKPMGRSRVRTGIRTSRDRSKIYGFLKQQCAEGRQVYVVYPVIDESEKVDLKAATTMAGKLAEELAPLAVGLVHGKLNADERDNVMRTFRDGGIDVLVATTVIEVGIDVPNATVMIVEHPERFGLAQLHQLRGRVGRGAEESHCILISDEGGGVTRERLRRFARTADGFKIAELDLRERGMGELAGVRQSGGIALRYTDLSKDDDLIVAARRTAFDVVQRDPTLETRDNEALRKRIERRYGRGMELFAVR